MTGQIVLALRGAARNAAKANAARAAGAESATLRAQKAEARAAKLRLEAAREAEIVNKARRVKRKKAKALAKAEDQLASAKTDAALVKPVVADETLRLPVKVYGPYPTGKSWRLVSVTDKQRHTTYPTRDAAETAKTKLLKGEMKVRIGIDWEIYATGRKTEVRIPHIQEHVGQLKITVRFYKGANFAEIAGHLEDFVETWSIEGPVECEADARKLAQTLDNISNWTSRLDMSRAWNWDLWFEDIF